MLYNLKLELLFSFFYSGHIDELFFIYKRDEIELNYFLTNFNMKPDSVDFGHEKTTNSIVVHIDK